MAAPSISKTARVVKLRHFFSAVVMLVALLAGWFAPPQHSFEQRWVSMPTAMSWDNYESARAAAASPSFCMSRKCRIG